MSAAGNVVPLRHRAATRFGPREARRLANIAVPRNGTARELLALFLRMCDLRRGFSRELKQEFLAYELGVHFDTIRRSWRHLERLGLVLIRTGGGRTSTVVTLDADALLAISLAHGLQNPLVNHAVSLGKPANPEPPKVAGAAPETCGGTPRNFCPPNARAREDPPSSSLEIPPNPPASRGAPDEPCPEHGEGCALRRCGRSPRRVAQAADRDLAERKRAAVIAAYRASSEAERAAATPATPEQLADIRESIRKSRYSTKGTDDENRS